MLAEDGTNATSLLENAFDSDYNFALYDSLKTASKMPAQAGNVMKAIKSDNLPYASFKMNFLDNHDKNTYDKEMKERFGDESLGALYTVAFTAYGVPLIYSGNEEDSDIALEFF